MIPLDYSGQGETSRIAFHRALQSCIGSAIAWSGPIWHISTHMRSSWLMGWPSALIPLCMIVFSAVGIILGTVALIQNKEMANPHKLKLKTAVVGGVGMGVGILAMAANLLMPSLSH